MADGKACPFCDSPVTRLKQGAWPQRECLRCGAEGPKQSLATPQWSWDKRSLASFTDEELTNEQHRRTLEDLNDG